MKNTATFLDHTLLLGNVQEESYPNPNASISCENSMFMFKWLCIKKNATFYQHIS